MSAKQNALFKRQNIGLPAWFNGQESGSDIIVSTRIRLARNLSNYRFPLYAPPRERTIAYEKVAAAIKSIDELKRFKIINFSTIPLLDQQFLVEERIASSDLLRAEGDRGVAFDGSFGLTVLINEKDHVRLQYLDPVCRPVDVWKKVSALDDWLGEVLDFAYDDRHGFLTSFPANAGTGLRVSFLMHLPGLVLTKVIDPVLQGAGEMGIATRGFFGEHGEVVGNFFQLSNQAAGGVNELEFIESARTVIAEVERSERDARHRLLRDARLEVLDKVHRAYGIMKHAKTLSMTEYLNLASALRFGIDCGIVADVGLEDLSRSTFCVMPAHLQHAAKKTMNTTELSMARADYARKLLNRRKRKKIPERNIL